MIFITGDTHGEIDIRKLNTKNFPVQRELTKDDYLIVCGDFGLICDGSKTDRWWQRWLRDKRFTTLFVDGNHENFDLLAQYPVEEWHGGKVQVIQPGVLHLMRGQVYDIDGKKFFTMGGAASHDKEWRKEGVSWWPQEMPSAEEYAEAERNLEKVGWSVDYVITHCAPTSAQLYINPTFTADELTTFFERLIDRLTWDKWYFGHYHRDMTGIPSMADFAGDGEAQREFRAIYRDVVLEADKDRWFSLDAVLSKAAERNKAAHTVSGAVVRNVVELDV